VSGPDVAAEAALQPSGVPWLPPFRLGPHVLRDGVLEVTHAPDTLRPFSRLLAEPEELGFRTQETELPRGTAAALRAALAAVPQGDVSRGARARRWQLATAAAAAAATDALQRIGSLPAWVEAAAGARRDLLRAIDAGRPPPASHLLATCRAVPQSLRALGNALPTAEALTLLTPLGRICELGAGLGLFARALERAGMVVAASDAATGEGTGIAFPVRRGFDAAATIAAFRAMGPLPPLLILWPQFDEGDWFAAAFAAVEPGGLIAMASPEFEFCLRGGLEAATGEERQSAGPGWHAAPDLMARIARDFIATGEAAVVPSGWPCAATPLRLWRRR
jgi:hypothetical protein